MRLGSGVGVAVVGIALLWAVAAWSEPLEGLEEQLRAEPFTLSADSLHYEMDRELYVARGNVRIEQNDRRLRADWAAFNRRTGRGVASGSVELSEAGDVVSADFVEFQLERLEGEIRGGRFESESSHFRAEAASIRKLGDRHYSFQQGRFTTCRCEEGEELDPCDPDGQVDPWAITAEEAELEVEGYATARDARFEVLGVPVAWLPWAAFPVKNERQTGLLVPELSFSSFNGFEIGLPWFWAPRDEIGLVLTPRYSTDWGFGAAAALDYAAGPRSGGELVAAYYHDEDIDPDTPDTPYGRDRWNSTGSQHWVLPGDVEVRAVHRLASDNDMPFDFGELEEFRNDRFLVSQASVSGAAGGLEQAGASLGARFVDDLQSPDDLDRDRFLLQRWPEVKLDLLPTGWAGLAGLVPSLDVDYAWFQARDSARGELPGAVAGAGGIFLDTGIDALPNSDEPQPGLVPVADPHGDDFGPLGGSEGDGLFQEGEPLADRGQRLLLHPRLALPVEWAGLQLVPEVGWHQTFYDTRRRGSRERGFLTARADLSTRLRRDFGAFVHVLEPQLGYALAWSRFQGRNTIFVPGTAVPQGRLRALELDSVTRDDADRIPRAQLLRAGAANRFYGSGGELWADVSLHALYDFEENALDALIVDGRAFPSEAVELQFHLDVDPERGSVDEGLLAARTEVAAGLTLHGAYRWVDEIPAFFEDFISGDRFDEDGSFRHINQAEAGFDVDLTRHWSLRYRLAHSFDDSRVLANKGGLEYFSGCGCWAVALTVSQDRTRDVDAALEVKLLGLGGDWEPRGPGLLDALGTLW